MRILGIDPGFKGAMAMLSDMRMVEATVMPTIKSEVGNETDYKIVERFIRRSDFVVIEKQQSMPVNGVKQAFNFGGHYYSLRCLVSIHDKPVIYPTKSRWAKLVMPDMKRGDKSHSISKFNQLYPGFNSKITDGIAEAVLIARYGFLSGEFNEIES